MKNYISLWWNRLGKFLRGDSPSYAHRQLREKGVVAYNTILMALFYYIVLTPLSLVLRLFYAPFLRMKTTKQRSYWRTKRASSDHERMY